MLDSVDSVREEFFSMSGGAYYYYHIFIFCSSSYPSSPLFIFPFPSFSLPTLSPFLCLPSSEILGLCPTLVYVMQRNKSRVSCMLDKQATELHPTPVWFWIKKDGTGWCSTLCEVLREISPRDSASQALSWSPRAGLSCFSELGSNRKAAFLAKISAEFASVKLRQVWRSGVMLLLFHG